MGRYREVFDIGKVIKTTAAHFQLCRVQRLSNRNCGKPARLFCGLGCNVCSLVDILEVAPGC